MDEYNPHILSLGHLAPGALTLYSTSAGASCKHTTEVVSCLAEAVILQVLLLTPFFFVASHLKDLSVTVDLGAY